MLPISAVGGSTIALRISTSRSDDENERCRVENALALRLDLLAGDVEQAFHLLADVWCRQVEPLGREIAVDLLQHVVVARALEVGGDDFPLEIA